MATVQDQRAGDSSGGSTVFDGGDLSRGDIPELRNGQSIGSSAVWRDSTHIEADVPKRVVNEYHLEGRQPIQFTPILFDGSLHMLVDVGGGVTGDMESERHLAEKKAVSDDYSQLKTRFVQEFAVALRLAVGEDPRKKITWYSVDGHDQLLRVSPTKPVRPWLPDDVGTVESTISEVRGQSLVKAETKDGEHHRLYWNVRKEMEEESGFEPGQKLAIRPTMRHGHMVLALDEDYAPWEESLAHVRQLFKPENGPDQLRFTFSKAWMRALGWYGADLDWFLEPGQVIVAPAGVLD